MALFHFTVTQTKRSKGQSAIASAAYRSGEKLYSEYYGEYSDYTRKRGVICSDILLPPHAPKEYADRQTLWNAVEKAERGKNAQLAYSFEISLQNEFSLEENIALAREFLFREFVSRGMTVDVSFHEKECEDGGTPNPHFHFLCPIRPMEQDGTWGIKQRREYVLDEEGNRIRDANGKYVFNAVPTTDWGSPETLEHWREAWAEMCNAKFAEKGLDVRIDHRSYERQGVDLLPTIHEGATVRAMEKKGIRTEKGEFNRWIKATNAVIKDIRKKISLLFDWITEIKAELAKPQTPDLVSLLNDYYTQRKAGAYSQKGKISNLKEMNETYNYLRANGIYTLEDLESRLQSHRTTVDGLKTTMDSQNARMKAIRSLNDVQHICNFSVGHIEEIGQQDNISAVNRQSGDCFRQRFIVDTNRMTDDFKCAAIREIGITDSELFQHFDGQFGKIDLSVSFPCQRVLIVPRFVPQYLFAEAIKGTGNSYIVRMRFHVFTSLRVRKGG